MPNENRSFFENFVEGWFPRQQEYLNQLNLAIQNLHGEEEEEHMLKELTTRVLLHYQHYYEAKSRAIKDDVFVLFSPPWLSYYERAFLWIAGFKPCLLFRVGEATVGDLSAEQVNMMERMKERVQSAERGLSQDFARVQEIMAEARLVQVILMGGRPVDGQITSVTETFERVKEAMEIVVESADLLRTTAAKEIVDMLRPVQAVFFLAGFTKLQLRIRACGLRRDSQLQT